MYHYSPNAEHPRRLELSRSSVVEFNEGDNIRKGFRCNWTKEYVSMTVDFGSAVN